MKTLKLGLLIVTVLVFASGMTFAQRGPRGSGSTGDTTTNPKLHRGDDRHFDLDDSCWKVFLSQLPADSARMLVQAIEEIKDIKLKIDTLLHDLRRAREAKDTAAIRRIKNAIHDLTVKGREDKKTIDTILRQYQSILIRVRKECGKDHRGGTVGLKVTPIMPNPATTSAHFSYTINAEEHVQIVIGDQGGNIVQQVFDGQSDAGEHDVRLDLSGLQPGMYLVRIQAGIDVNTLKLMIARQ